MEIMYFVLGVVTVLLIIGVVIVVKVGTQLRNVESNFEHLERVSTDFYNELNSRIDRELMSLNSHVDSRFDKFESKIKQKLPKE